MALRRDIIVRRVDGDIDLTVTVGDPALPFTELLHAVGLEPGPCTVDGRLVPASTSVLDARLRSGSVVAGWQRSEPRESSPPPLAVLEQIGGLKSGGSVPLGTGEYVVGPSTEAGFDMGVPDEVAFRVTVEPNRRLRVAPAETNVAIGGRAIVAEEVLLSDVISVGTTLFNIRVPGQTEFVGADHEPVTPTVEPQAGPAGRSRRGLGFIGAAVALLIVAVAVAPPPNVVVPVAATAAVLIGLWWLTWYGDDQGRLTPGPAQSTGHEMVTASPRSHPRPNRAAELRSERPNIAEIIRGADSALQPPGSAPFRSDLEIVVAYGHLAGANGNPLRWAPVISQLSVGPLAVVGPRRAVLAVARSVIVAVTGAMAPGRLPIGLGHDPATGGDWEWLKWLPHIRTPATEGVAPFVIFDDQTGRGDPNDHGRELLANHTTGLVLTHPGGVLPAFCRQVLTVAADGTCSYATGEGTTEGLVAVGIDLDTALRAARAMCRTVEHLSVLDVEARRDRLHSRDGIDVVPYRLESLRGSP